MTSTEDLKQSSKDKQKSNDYQYNKWEKSILSFYSEYIYRVANVLRVVVCHAVSSNCIGLSESNEGMHESHRVFDTQDPVSSTCSSHKKLGVRVQPIICYLCLKIVHTGAKVHPNHIRFSSTFDFALK